MLSDDASASFRTEGPPRADELAGDGATQPPQVASFHSGSRTLDLFEAYTLLSQLWKNYREKHHGEELVNEYEQLCLDL